MTLFPFTGAREKISVKMHSTESGFVIGPSDTLFAGVYVSTFQPRNFTGWGSEGVNVKIYQIGAHCKAKDQNLETTLKQVNRQAVHHKKKTSDQPSVCAQR